MANTALNRTVQTLLTNKSGGNLNYGDVVIGDTSNAEGFTTTTSAGYSSTEIGVILEPNGIASNASGMVATAGWIPKINLNTAATAWQLIKTHTVAGQGTPHSSPQVEGDFAFALDASATPAAILFGSPKGAGTGGTTPGGSNTQVQYNNSGSFGGITGATTNGTALTLVAPILGTPASGTLTNCTGLPATTGLITVPGNICEGRLTTESGVPVSTSDRTAQGTLYWTPCTASGVAIGTGQITLYNGTNLVTKAITELSLALTVTSGSNYDVFVDYNSGTPQLVLSSAWTNDTTRADALATQAGIVVKSGTAAYRWVGTIRASGANVTADADATRYVWNTYNQVPRRLRKTDSTSHSYNGGYRQWNNSTANQIAFVQGVSATALPVSVYGDNTVTAAKFALIAPALDSTSAPSTNGGAYASPNATTEFQVGISDLVIPGLGYHFVAILQSTLSGGSMTFNGFGLSATFLC